MEVLPYHLKEDSLYIRVGPVVQAQLEPVWHNRLDFIKEREPPDHVFQPVVSTVISALKAHYNAIALLYHVQVDLYDALQVWGADERIEGAS